VHDYPAVDCGLLRTCSCGIGKTHLAAAIIRGLKKGAPCLFRECGALLKDVQASFDRKGEATKAKFLKPVYETEVVVLDELGASKPTNWARETMAQVIGRRYNDRKLTIFTTNYLDERHTLSEKTPEDRFGVRLRSRLYEMSRTTLVSGRIVADISTSNRSGGYGR
jgi:DNA replication protein DnaC